MTDSLEHKQKTQVVKGLMSDIRLNYGLMTATKDSKRPTQSKHL